MHMSETIASLIALCEASGIRLAGIPCPLTPLLPGVASDLMRTYASDGLILPMISGIGQPLVSTTSWKGVFALIFLLALMCCLQC